jgi:hypothetical protein
MILIPSMAVTCAILWTAADGAVSDEVALAAITERLTSWTTIAAEVEIAMRPNPEAAPETVYGSAVQAPYDHVYGWEWSATGREWLEGQPVRREGQGYFDRSIHAVSRSESWHIIYGRKNDERIHSVTRWRQAIPPTERASSVVLPAVLGVCVPGLEGNLLDLLQRKNRPLIAHDETGVIVDFGACPISKRDLYVKARFLPERAWSLGEIWVRDPTMPRAPRRDGSTVEQETRIVVNEWRTVQDEMTGETVWFPEQMTRTTSAGIYTVLLRTARVGFAPDEIRGCPELPTGTRVQEMGSGPGVPVKLYVIGGEAALDAQMEAHVNAARQALSERERTGQWFDARPNHGVGWIKPVWIVSLLVLFGAAGWRWHRRRAR